MKPFCVILTHRHGACVGIILNTPSLIKSDFIETVHQYALNKHNLLQSFENFEFISDKRTFVLSRVLGKTAENLTNLFQFSCDLLNLSKKNRGDLNFILGTGPGSFTGLRLGCAFTNGLNFASDSKHNLFSVSTLLTPDLLTKCSEYQKLKDILFDELGNYHTHDASSGYVTFFDLFYILHEIKDDKMTLCSHFVPNYNKDPSPVLNLRKE